jgi:hypothetical protein
MPRKRRAIKTRRGELSPSWHFYLLAGACESRLAPRRLPGWLDVLQADDEGALAVWREHRDELMTEAREAGFEPFGLLLERDPECDDVLPPDAARTAWSQRFCEEWSY